MMVDVGDGMAQNIEFNLRKAVLVTEKLKFFRIAEKLE